MAGQMQRPNQRPTNKPSQQLVVRSTSKPPIRSSNKSYKKGKLSKNARFSPRRIKWTPIIVLACVLATFIFAMIFGNILGKKAEQSQNTIATTQNPSNITPPITEKVAPYDELQAYFVDLQHASPDTNISLSAITAIPRSKGNALFVNIKNSQNEIIYSSEKLDELGFQHQDNLSLSRIKNHFEYYEDYAVGFFKSDFSATMDEEITLKLQTNEILLLKEATDSAFNQIIIEFSGNVTKNNLIYYQTYLLNLKLACPNTPIGITFSKNFMQNSDNVGNIAGLLGIVDFFALDLSQSNVEEIKNTLDNIIYFTERYNCVIMLSAEDEIEIGEKISVISQKGIKNYIIK